MKRLAIATVLLLSLSASILCGQTGLPRWGSFDASSFDAVNRQNLNVNLKLPLVSAPSRGGTFSYALVYDSLIWEKSGNAWVPVSDLNGTPTWGWKDSQAIGATKYFHGTVLCDTVPPQSSSHYFGYKYTDGGGTVHPFALNFYLTATACQFNTGPRTGFATDGSGYYVDATSAAAPVVYSPRETRSQVRGQTPTGTTLAPSL